MLKDTQHLRRLKQHAGLCKPGEAIPADTLAEFIFRVERGGCSIGLDEIAVDLIACLDAVNREFDDFDSAGLEGRDFDGELVYAVSGIVMSCLDKAFELLRRDRFSNTGFDLLELAWMIQCAWDALLAGDIEDLASHVRGEKKARVGSGRIIG